MSSDEEGGPGTRVGPSRNTTLCGASTVDLPWAASGGDQMPGGCMGQRPIPPSAVPLGELSWGASDEGERLV